MQVENEYLGGKKSKVWTYIIGLIVLIVAVIGANFAWSNPTLAREGGRPPNYGPRVFDLSRWLENGAQRYIWIAKVRGTSRVSSIHEHQAQAQVEQLADAQRVERVEFRRGHVERSSTTTGMTRSVRFAYSS